MVRLAFLGDTMLGRLVNRQLKEESPEFPWGDTLAALQEADWRICNLECVISDRGRPWSLTQKYFHFRSDAKNVAVLKAAGIDAVSVANNHVLDYDFDAFAEMTKLLDQNEILHAGAGKNREESRRPACWTCKGQKLAMIAFTDNEPEWEATEDRPGVFYVPLDHTDSRQKELMAVARKTKESSDILIASAHWGGNWGEDPPEEHMKVARELIDNGVDIVFGHSPHICRAVEFYRDRPIIYSAGDFIDDYAVDEVERNDRSFIFIVEIQDNRKFRVQMVPTVIRHFQALYALGLERRAIVEQMIRKCRERGTKATWNEAIGAVEAITTNGVHNE